MKINPPVIYNQKSDLPAGVQVVEYFKEAQTELFFIEHPRYKKEMPEAQAELAKYLQQAKTEEVWIYYPWLKQAIHTVGENDYLKLRTARNKNIINSEEQKKYRATTVGIIGLSIGSDTLSSLAYTGGPKKLKIADFDTIEISNLNRMKADLTEIGQNKCLVAARRVWRLDPFTEIEPWTEEVSMDKAKRFITDKPKLDVLVDAMDTLDVKIYSRLICRENKIPVVMATSNGDSIILDVERFDLEPSRQLFHGLIGQVDANTAKGLSARKNYQDWLKLATKIVGPSYLTTRLQESLSEIGKSIAGVPQLGSTVSISGAAVSFIIRRIANQQKMPSGRYIINLEKLLTIDNLSSNDHLP